MTTFDDKEKAAENKYAYDKEMEFKIHARAHKLLGLWAAEKMGFSSTQADEYAKSVVTGEVDSHRVLEKIRHDLLTHDIHVNDHDIRAEIFRTEQIAREQITAGK